MEKFNVEVICRNLDTGHEVKAVIVSDEENDEIDVKLNMGGLSEDDMKTQGHSLCMFALLDTLGDVTDIANSNQ
jgi:hypothetical protein